jgi:hypothetical protein
MIVATPHRRRWWQTGTVPLLDSALAQVIFAFVMIGLFAFVLRWTFSGSASLEQPDDAQSSAAPAHSTDASLATTMDPVAAGTPSTRDMPPGSPRMDSHEDQPQSPAISAVDDYGLLAPAAIVDSAEHGARTRELLGRAGIRATTTIGTDGRHRVLVFARDLDRARRVAGSSG